MHETVEALYEILKDYSKSQQVKGATIFRNSESKMTVEEDEDTFTVQVPSESSNLLYEVQLGTDEGWDECTCPAHEKFFQCKHVPAAIFQVLVNHLGILSTQVEKVAKVKLGGGEIAKKATSTSKAAPKKEAKPASTQAAWKTISTEPQYLRGEISNRSHSYYPDYRLKQSVRTTNETPLEGKGIHWSFVVWDKANQLFPEIIYDKKNTYEYRCTCKQKSEMCSHVQAVFESVLDRDPSFFVKHRDWTTEKAALLKPYGLKLSDPEARFFEFTVEHGRLLLKEPSFIWKQGATDKLARFKTALTGADKKRPGLPKNTFIDFEIAFLLNFSSKHFANGFELEPIKLTTKKGKPAAGKLSLHQPENFPLLKNLPDEVYNQLLQLGDTEIKRWLQHNTSTYFLSNLSLLPPEVATKLEGYYAERLHKLWPFVTTQKVYVLNEGKFSVDNIFPATASAATIKPSFHVKQEGQFISIELYIEKEGHFYAPGQFRFRGNMLLEIDNIYHLPAADDWAVLQLFAQGFIRLHESDKTMLIREMIPQLQKKYQVEVPEPFRVERAVITPKPQVLLKEYNNQYLMLQPQFDYDGLTAAYDPDDPTDLMQLGTDGKLQSIARDTVAEDHFFESLRPLHPAFEQQQGNPFFYLPFADVMKGNWFLKAIPQLHQQEVPVLGINELEKFKYNTNPPKWEMKAGSGIDWFDLKVEISFGDQQVSLLEVRKAVLSGENVVVLGDGTFGLLPEEWLKQYGMLLKMGNAKKDGTLQISKLHYTLIDELHGQINDADVLQEIEAKKEKLRNIGNIETAKPSKSIKATHRPYQLSGFQWLQVLDEVGWGGCLADDMGLGKTLQAITFLQYLKEKYSGSTHLVVCPTSLIYNWQTELEKFAPALNYHIYYGKERDFSEEHFESYDLVLTSYGILRLDIEQLMQFHWHYVILDESQAIKNPDAQVTKALQLINSKNRLILSGTPVQNNTYDLYAQFNFINPGLLGNREFFKTEFANPIDKQNDAERSSQLRRLVYPFLLRRTKQQVAPDLPDKTEMTLWCDMPKDQRAVYDHYKDYYRKLLMQKIEEEGLMKAGMYVLEGLLRLRQICDSPQLLKAKDVKSKTSIKINELMRELEENAGGHKLLVFSQFTEMLGLIRKELEKEGISYCYLDGSTPAEKRQEAVEQFQQNAEYRVFLISLKAGGVGLNLTAADYVYLVDPWWNPAVEQQAIDRTHRIGQTQKIFAYKMICKDTVEEKILELQARKKQLANDLVTEDAGFIKKLTKDDVAFLFS